jgi:hypothetical protein
MEARMATPAKNMRLSTATLVSTRPTLWRSTGLSSCAGFPPHRVN